LAACSKPNGYVADNTDCCDSDAVANPGYLAAHMSNPWKYVPDNCGNYLWNCDGTTVVMQYPWSTLGSACSPNMCTTTCPLDCNGYENVNPNCGQTVTHWSVSCALSSAGCAVASTATGSIQEGCY
jgi:hypothetical protein